MQYAQVEGRTPVRIRLYALSTCSWCKKTKALLNELGLGYEYIDVDQLDDDEDVDAVELEVTRFNPACSFPTMVVDDERCIVGFQEDAIRGLLRT